MSITESLIVKLSGEYDCEVVTRLKLERLGINRIENLVCCLSLIELSLARNNITLISDLDSLKSLRKLDLSFNRIAHIENLDGLECLEWLSLRGNCIANVEEVNHLSHLQNFTSLELQGSDGKDGNPGCNHPAYSAIISRCLPNLLILDGGLIGVADASAQVAKALADIKPQALNEDDYKVKSWIDESFAETPETVFPQSIEETMDAIRDMLKVESSHLLRQSNAVLNKTKS